MQTTTENSPRLLLIDGMGVLRRIYEANGDKEADDLVASTLEAFKGSMHRALNENNPTHVLAAFDADGPNWRHTLYPNYKAHRPPTPAAVLTAKAQALSYLDELGLSNVVIEGVEADDVLASMACKASSFQVPTLILSTDKDLYQLIDDFVHLRHHFKRETHGLSYVKETYGIEPTQLGDYLSLVGDRADGVPGAAGIGHKTAIKLLQQYQSLDAIFVELDDISGRTGQLLRDSREAIVLSRQLVHLKTDVKVGLRFGDLRYHAQ